MAICGSVPAVSTDVLHALTDTSQPTARHILEPHDLRMQSAESRLHVAAAPILAASRSQKENAGAQRSFATTGGGAHLLPRI